MNADDIVIGPCTIYVDNTDIGLTTEAGVTFGEPIRRFEDIWDDRSLLLATKILTRVSRTISFELQEVTQNALREFYNLLSLSPVTYGLFGNVMDVVVSGPAPSGTTFTYTTQCWSVNCGNMVRSKSREVVLPVVLEEKGNYWNHNSSFGVWAEI